MKFKPVFRNDRHQKKYRLFRILWTRGVVGDGKGYSAKLSFGIVPKLLFFNHEGVGEYRITLLFLTIHYRKSWGGIQV